MFLHEQYVEGFSLQSLPGTTQKMKVRPPSKGSLATSGSEREGTLGAGVREYLNAANLRGVACDQPATAQDSGWSFTALPNHHKNLAQNWEVELLIWGKEGSAAVKRSQMWRW